MPMTTTQSAILSHIQDKFRGNAMDDAQSITCIITGETSYDIHPEHDDEGSFFISINGHVADDDPRVNNVPTFTAAKEEVARRMAEKVEAAREVMATFETLAAQNAA